MRVLILCLMLVSLGAWAAGPYTGANSRVIPSTAVEVLDQRLAGERNEDSITGTDHVAVSQECASSGAIDLSVNTSTTVYNGPAVLCGIVLSVTVGVAAVTIDDNATVRYPIPIALPIGAHDGFGTIHETSLVVNPDDLSTGTLYVYFRPLDAGVTWAY